MENSNSPSNSDYDIDEEDITPEAPELKETSMKLIEK